MKKLIPLPRWRYAAVLIIVLCSVVFAIESMEPLVEKTFKKLDYKTIEVTTVTTSTSIAEFDRAVLQTELDHIPDERARLQKMYDAVMNAVNEREAELIKMLELFK